MMTPVVASWGAGLDSSAMIVELTARGTPPDLVLLAATGNEFPQTDTFIPTFRRWLDAHHIENHIVTYRPSRLNGRPSYETLLENLLATATLPAIAFGRHTCSLKWKVAPQDAYLRTWTPAITAWRENQPVVRLIGYDASPRDTQRYHHAQAFTDHRFLNRYPLREWNWTREQSARRMIDAGLPVPHKSSCFFCTAAKAQEIANLPPVYLELIVLLEAAAAPRLRTVEGLWRRSTKGTRGAPPRPGRMTDFIATNGLLEATRIDHIQTAIAQSLTSHIAGETPASMAEWLAHHFPGYADARAGEGRGQGDADHHVLEYAA